MAFHPKANKRGAVKTTVNGVKFDSKLEAERYKVLRLLERAGEISNLRLQVPYKLECREWIVNGKTVNVELNGRAHMYRYVADFVYIEAGKEIVEDVKSSYTASLKPYKIKKKLMKEVYGIEIRETGKAPKRNKRASKRSTHKTKR